MNVELAISEDATILDAIQVINSNSLQAVCIVDENSVLLGILNDGDIRRGLASGAGLSDIAASVMNTSPKTALVGTNAQDIQSILVANEISQIPIIDENGVLVDLITHKEIIKSNRLENWVVLMAGGKGSRLMPLTENLPKPLIKVAGKPIIETIIESFRISGYRKFFISINYLGEQIKDYLQDGQKWQSSIQYLDEPIRTGTAGSLALMKTRPSEPFFIMNSDILTNVSFNAIRKKHIKEKNVLTVCARTVETQIAYGVLQTDGDQITGCIEKPTERRQVNAGIYMASPEVFDIIGDELRMFNMTDVLDECIERGWRVGIFNIHEYWRDIGQLSDLQVAKNEYHDNF